MSGATFSFLLSAGVALVAATLALALRHPARSLASFAVAMAALSIPCLQLRAPALAAILLLNAAIVVALLLALVRLAPAPAPRRRVRWSFWGAALAGLAGFTWVLLATASRQFVDPLPALEGDAGLSEGALVLVTLSNEFVVPTLLVGLLALCAVIAAVLSLVVEARPKPVTSSAS